MPTRSLSFEVKYGQNINHSSLKLMFQQATEYLSKLFFFFNTMKKVLKAIRENRLEKEAVLHGGGQGKLC